MSGADTAPMTGTRRLLGHRSTAVLLVGALLTMGMAGCGTTSTTVATTRSAIRAPDVTWMISAGALERLAASGLPGPLLQAYFDQRSTIVLGATGSTPDPLVPKATPAADFTSAAALVAALQQKKIPARVKYLVLDLEAWPLTPIDEQHDPIAAARRALAAAHGAGKQVIFTPAFDLLHVLEPGRPPSPTAQLRMFERDVVVPGATASDVLEIQSQQTEGTPLATIFAPSAIKAAHSARPGERVLAGLSTNPGGRRVTPANLHQLYAAAVAGGASGFWLNIPESGALCPRCGIAQPEVAVQFLEQLAGAHGLPTLVAGYWLNVPAPGSGCPECHEPDPALMTEALQDVAR